VRDASPRVAIVGAGLMGGWHAHAARQAGARVVTIVDRDRSHAERLAARYRGCRGAVDPGESLGTADVVHVCTPPATHVPLARQALEARRHVVVEKPVAPSVDAAATLLEVAAANGVLLCPVHQFLFQDGVEAAFARLGAIQPLRHVGISMCSAGADGTDEATRERVATEILAHPLSLLARLLPAAPPNVEWSVRHPAPGEIRILTEAGGLTASIVVSMSGRPTANRMELVGAGGTIVVDLFHGFAAMLDGTVSRRRKIARPFTEAATLAGAAAANLARRAWRREAAYPGLRTLLQRFYGAAASGGACPITPVEILSTVRACDRLGELLAASQSPDG
jgi:predicted dehydrogenase